MKKILLTLAILSLVLMGFAQETNIKKSTIGVQTGIMGIWINNELLLAKKLTLKSELGLDLGLWESS